MSGSPSRRRGRGAREVLPGISAEVLDPHAAGHRHTRLQQILFEELSSLLRDEVSDPALDDVAVTSVELSVDYRHARVRFRPPSLAVERALERATPFLRARLADALDTKFVPALRFVPDHHAPPTELE